MRLICPNCDAEYEVEDSAIPDTGRDVQCSNCGHAWYQLPPEIELALEQEEALFGEVTEADVSAPDVPAGDVAGRAAETVEPPRRSLDEDLVAILREEAEREAAARRAEMAGLETQPELGLAAPAGQATVAAGKRGEMVAGEAGSGAGAAVRRIAQLKGIDPDAAPPEPPRPVARRDLLPDIEEINSSLKGSDLPVEPEQAIDPVAAQAQARGFRSGFALSLMIAVIALAAYVAAPQIKAQMPGATAAVDGYVAAVDSARLWLDRAMRAATEAVRGLADQGGSAT